MKIQCSDLLAHHFFLGGLTGGVGGLSSTGGNPFSSVIGFDGFDAFFSSVILYSVKIFDVCICYMLCLLG